MQQVIVACIKDFYRIGRYEAGGTTISYEIKIYVATGYSSVRI